MSWNKNHDDSLHAVLTNIMLNWPISNTTNIDQPTYTFQQVLLSVETKFNQLENHFHKILNNISANILQVGAVIFCNIFHLHKKDPRNKSFHFLFPIVIQAVKDQIRNDDIL